MNLFFPVNCAACGGYVEITMGKGVCKKCCGELVPVNARGCSFCGRPLPARVQFCRSCTNKHSEIDEFYTAFYYEGVVRELIRKFKYEDARYLRGILGDCLVELFKARVEKNFGRGIIVPVPLHGEKLKKRGFNQAEVIAGPLSAASGIKLNTRALKRIKNTAPQYTRKRRQRFENLRGAFRAGERFVSGSDIILVDDVSTTGATLQQAAAALKSAGGGKITAMTIAHGR